MLRKGSVSGVRGGTRVYAVSIVRQIAAEQDRFSPPSKGKSAEQVLRKGFVRKVSQSLTKLREQNMLRNLLQDESGFIVSAELVLVATILVIGMIVGLSEIQHAVVQELNDVADAIGALNQSYSYSGFSSKKSNGGGNGGIKSFTNGSAFVDLADDCDANQCDLTCDVPAAEAPKF